MQLTHWGRVTHICVSNVIITGSDNGLSPGRRQAIISTNAGILLIGLRGTKFSEILIEICTFSFKIMHLKMSSGKWRPFCLGLNVLSGNRWIHHIQHNLCCKSYFLQYRNPIVCISTPPVIYPVILESGSELFTKSLAFEIGAENAHTLKPTSRQNAKVFVTRNTNGCHRDNL